MAGSVVSLQTVFDTGAFSVKSVSVENEGAFMSMAAPVSLHGMDGFAPFQSSKKDSYRLELIYTNEQGRFDYGNRKGWVLGESAAYEDNVMYTERNMQRFNSELYMPFIAGALRTAFPEYRHNLEEVKKQGWLIDKRWATPVSITASIAPGYYALSHLIENALMDKHIAFVDMQTKGVYVFYITSVNVVPESFGSYQYMLYDVPPKGTKVAEGQQIPRNKQADILERLTVTVVDFGGRTFDWMTWQGREIIPNRYGTETIGFNDAVDNIAKDVFSAFPGLFSSQPTRHDVLMVMRKGGKMELTGVAGKKVSIAELVMARMNNFATSVENVWRNRLGSGQGIQVLALGGGAALDATPYITNRLMHDKRRYVALNKDSYDMFMANSVGTMLYLMNGGAIKK